MSKELPFFKFEVAEYLAGDIMICSLEAQGLFAIIKSIYWQKDCELTVEKIRKRYDRPDLIKELEDENCIKIDDEGNIEISFLMSQYKERLINRKKLSEAGKKGARIKKAKATLKPPLSQEETTHKQLEENREEEIRIEENREDEEDRLTPSSLYSIEVLKEDYLRHEDTLSAVVKNKANKFKSVDHLKLRLDDFVAHLLQNNQRVKTPSDFASHFRYWNKRNTKKTNKPKL